MEGSAEDDCVKAHALMVRVFNPVNISTTFIAYLRSYLKSKNGQEELRYFEESNWSVLKMTAVVGFFTGYIHVSLLICYMCLICVCVPIWWLLTITCSFIVNCLNICNTNCLKFTMTMPLNSAHLSTK